MPLKVCSEPRCPTLVPTGTPRCPTHTAQRERQRGTRQQRGYGPQHQQTLARLRRLYPSGPCHRCGRPGTWNPEAPPNQRLTGGHLNPNGPPTPDNEKPEHLTCNVRDARRRDNR